MKKSIVILTGLAVLSTGAYFSTYLFAQQGGGGGAPQVQGTKVAVVNIGYVFNKYSRSVAFKKELEDILSGPKAEAKKLMDEAVRLEKDIRDGKVTGVEKDKHEEQIIKLKRRLDDMDRDIRKVLGKKSEDNLVTLWREVNMGIKAVSEAYGFQIVLGFGDPMEKELLNLFPNVNRKMQAMDQGGSVPLYIHGSVDLSNAVAETLNRWTQPEQKGVAPAGK